VTNAHLPTKDPAKSGHWRLKFRSTQFVPASLVSAPVAHPVGKRRETISAMSHKENAETSQPVPDIVRDLVQRAESKLAELEARKQYLRRRVQALRFLAGHNADNPPAERQESVTSAPSSSEHHLEQRTSDPDFGKGTTRLRRACRIALLESEAPQTSREICQRISKRGSLLFQTSTDPVHIISAELELMAKESEITCRVLEGENRWQRPVVTSQPK
jgi:hypothetical protein